MRQIRDNLYFNDDDLFALIQTMNDKWFLINKETGNAVLITSYQFNEVLQNLDNSEYLNKFNKSFKE